MPGYILKSCGACGARPDAPTDSGGDDFVWYIGCSDPSCAQASAGMTHAAAVVRWNEDQAIAQIVAAAAALRKGRVEQGADG